MARVLGLLLASLFALGVAACGGDAGPARPPNILLYVVDTLRADELACYGSEVVHSPHVDRMAREGLLFENAFANASWTRPSIATIFTGRHPHRHGTQGRNDVLAEELPTLAGILGWAGYQTGFLNTNPNVGTAFGFERGFDDIFDLYARRKPGFVWPEEMITPSDQVSRRVIDWIDAAQAPFFIAVLTTDPHAPYTPPAHFDLYGGDYQGDIDGSRASLRRKNLTEAEQRRIHSLYRAEVSFNDDSLGTLLADLDERGRLDDTLIVFTSDHGEEFWEYPARRGHGQSLTDSVLHVPLVIRLPGGTPTGRVARPVQLADLMPTLLEFAGVPVPPGVDGRSLLGGGRPRDPASSDPQQIYASILLGARQHMVREYPWKLVWGITRDRFQLYDVSSELGESRALRRPLPPGALAAYQRLRNDLRAWSARADAPVPRQAGEIPEDVKSALRELGYIE